jgi:hypothetical protein
MDVLAQRHVLGVAQLGIRLGVAVLVAADGGRLVPLGERGEDGLAQRRRELEAAPLDGGVQGAIEGGAVGVEGVRQGGECRQQGLPQPAARGHLHVMLVQLLLLAGRQILEGARLPQPLQALLFMYRSDLQMAKVSGCDSWPKR